MGTFYAACHISNHIHRHQEKLAPKLLVDTGSEYSWISEKTLQEINTTPEKKDVAFVMANGTSITRKVGFAVFRIGKNFTIDEVVFAQGGDLQLLGARTLEGLNLRVDPRNKQLVAAGPLPAAPAESAVNKK